MTAKPNASDTNYNIPTSYSVALQREYPDASRLSTGWVSGNKPSHKHFNWNWDWMFKWTKYFDTIIDEILGSISGLSNVPIGAILEYPCNTLPSGTSFMWADGSAISRTTYASLFTLYGTIHGVGDNSTTFNLPNKMDGKVAVGVDTTQTEFNTLNKTGGTKTHILTETEMPSHIHNINGSANQDGEDIRFAMGNNGGHSSANSNATGGGAAHNNLQPYRTTRYIVRVL
jgi:microcystin-dependent protein